MTNTVAISQLQIGGQLQSSDIIPVDRLVGGVLTTIQVTAGTLTPSAISPNLIYAGPTTGVSAIPTFRSLVAADFPTNLTAIALTIGSITTTNLYAPNASIATLTAGVISMGTVGSITTGSINTQSLSVPTFSISVLTVTTSGTIPTISAGSNNTKIINSAYVDRGASGASWVLLGSVTASSTAAIQFTSIPAGYKNYVAVLSDIVPGTVGTNLLAQVSENNGSTWGSGNPYTYGNQFWDYSSTSNGGATTTNFLLAQAVGTAGNGVVGSVLFSALGATGNYKSINSDLTYYYNAVPTPGGYKTTGYYNADTNAINAIQFIMSSGNIASGTISLYGIRNT